MTLPNWYELVLLALATYRTFRLIADDVIFDRPRIWLVGKLGKPFEEWATCPWCAGFWLSLLWWIAFELWPHGTPIAAVPFAISALVGVVAYFTSD